MFLPGVADADPSGSSRINQTNCDRKTSSEESWGRPIHDSEILNFILPISQNTKWYPSGLHVCWSGNGRCYQFTPIIFSGRYTYRSALSTVKTHVDSVGTQKLPLNGSPRVEEAGGRNRCRSKDSDQHPPFPIPLCTHQRRGSVTRYDKRHGSLALR